MMFIEDQKLNKPSVICLTETWLSDDSTLSLFEIPEYHRLISHAGFNRNNGAGIYVHKSLRYQVVKFHESLPAAAVKCTNASKNCFMVTCVYNSPSCDKLRSYKFQAPMLYCWGYEHWFAWKQYHLEQICRINAIEWLYPTYSKANPCYSGIENFARSRVSQ